MAYKVLLFLGAGGNVGAASVALFKSKGYKVASAARTIRDEITASSDLVVTADFSDPNVVRGIFEKVEQQLGVPNVVIYNAYSWSVGPDPANPLSAPIENLQKDLAVNTISAYAAAQAAVEGFGKLSGDVKTTFMYTGNAANTFIMPELFGLAVTKTTSWYLVQTLVATPLFASKGYRFYYVDERTPEGKGMRFISGPGHAQFFLQLAEQEKQGEPLATFVRGKGYVGFEGSERAVLPVGVSEERIDWAYGA
ncbi:hypothetical protein LTR10_023509 [Elasticomyces elasticus]|nr:hypothetical protein LTR10_023509 [Elasticomyces elasticus]KAK4979381.1 hypothetical protein LTR42_001884 [Elasticomyces elasticus]